MSIIKRRHGKDNPYLAVSRKVVQSCDLSWRARGLLIYLLSLPGDWKIRVSELPKHSTDGRDATRRAFNELLKMGYIRKDERRENTGVFRGVDYTVDEIPFRVVNSVKEPTESEIADEFIAEERENERWEELVEPRKKKVRQ